jgi:UDP-glucose 4-epimerase
MKILITGGAGFIGSHLSDYLVSKKKIKKVIVLDNVKDGSLKNLKNSRKSKKFSFFKADIRDFKKINNIFKKVDVVYHLAALSDVVPSIEEPIEYLNTNIMGTVNVLEAMRNNNVKKIIYAASSSCYGIPIKYPTNESESINPKYPYAFSKYIGEQTIIHWSKIYKLNYVSLRLFNVYGTRSRTNSAYGAALGVFLKQKILNYPFTVIGNGMQKRDFIYVADVINAFYLSLNEKVNNNIFNIGSGTPRSVNEMVNLIKGKKIFIPKRPGEPEITHADIFKAKSKLRWFPRINLERGLKVIMKDINYWKNSPLWTPKKIKVATKNWFKYLKN